MDTSVPPLGGGWTGKRWVLALDELRLVAAPQVLQDAVVEGLGQLRRHGRVEVRLVALQNTLQRELAHAQHLEVPVHHALGPGPAGLVLKQPQVEDLSDSENTRGSAVRIRVHGGEGFSALASGTGAVDQYRSTTYKSVKK